MPELTQIVHASRAQFIGRRLVEKLKIEVPRQLYKVSVQAKIGSRVLASETIKPFRKDVTADLVSFLLIQLIIEISIHKFFFLH